MPYKLCPRCELNYIPEEEDLCGVCKAELKIGPQLMFAIDDEEESEKLCPVCKSVYIPIGEDMCDSCKEKSLYNSDTIDDEKDDSWREFLDEDEKDEISKEGDEDIISLSEIEKEEAQFDNDDDEDEDEFAEQEADEEPDDFEYLPVDEKDFEDTDEEEEDEEEDEEDDF